MKPDKPILKRIFWVLSNSSGRGQSSEGLLKEILPLMSHYGDLYLISESLEDDWDHVTRLTQEVHVHLLQWRFCRLNLRPVHLVREGERVTLEGIYKILHQWGDPFFREALRHQVVSRWMVLPVLKGRSQSEVREALQLARFLRERIMIPSFCVPDCSGTKELAASIDTDQERLIFEGPGGPLGSLFFHALFDDLLQWTLSSAGGFSVEPCATLMIDTVRRRARRCPQGEERGYAAMERVLIEDGVEGCRRCWHNLPGNLREAMRWNRRVDEMDKIEHQLGVLALAHGDLGRAERHFQHLSSGADSDEIKGESLLYLGILYLQRGKIEEAHGVLTNARALLGDAGEVLYHLGRCDFAWRDYISAADLFHQAHALGVSHEIQQDLLLYLGISHIHLEEFAEALDILNRAEGSLPLTLFYRAMAVLGLGRLQEALATFQEALASGPAPEDLASVQFYVGHCYKEMAQWEDAIPHLELALEADPQSYDAWNLLGYCHFRLGSHHKAVQAFLKALEIKPKSGIDYANVASNMRELGDLDEAVRWYRKALQLDPSLGFASQNLQKLEERRQEKEKREA